MDYRIMSTDITGPNYIVCNGQRFITRLEVTDYLMRLGFTNTEAYDYWAMLPIYTSEKHRETYRVQID